MRESKGNPKKEAQAEFVPPPPLPPVQLRFGPASARKWPDDELEAWRKNQDLLTLLKFVNAPPDLLEYRSGRHFTLDVADFFSRTDATPEIRQAACRLVKKHILRVSCSAGMINFGVPLEDGVVALLCGKPWPRKLDLTSRNKGGVTVAQIATVLGMSVQRVKGRLYRARKKDEKHGRLGEGTWYFLKAQKGGSRGHVVSYELDHARKLIEGDEQAPSIEKVVDNTLPVPDLENVLRPSTRTPFGVSFKKKRT